MNPTSLSVCQVARATGEAKCHGSKLHKEVYWFIGLFVWIPLNSQKVRMDYSRHDIYTCNHVGFRKIPLLISEKNARTGANISTFLRFAGFSQKH